MCVRACVFHDTMLNVSNIHTCLPNETLSRVCWSFVRLMQSLSTTENNSQRFDPIINDYDFTVTVILAETVHGLFC